MERKNICINVQISSIRFGYEYMTKKKQFLELIKIF